MSQLTKHDYERAIAVIEEHRSALIMSWVQNPAKYSPNFDAGILRRMRSDVEHLRFLLGELRSEPLTNQGESGVVVPINTKGCVRHTPDWLLEHAEE